jgi:hypothetical protein
MTWVLVTLIPNDILSTNIYVQMKCLCSGNIFYKQMLLEQMLLEQMLLEQMLLEQMLLEQMLLEQMLLEPMSKNVKRHN